MNRLSPMEVEDPLLLPTDRSVEIAVIAPLHPFVLDALRQRFTVHDAFADPLAALAGVGASIRGVATGGMAGLSRAQMELMPKLEICAINGVGLETTDLAFARERGVVVTTATVLYDDVADLAIALALAACRRVAAGDRFVRSGRWSRERFALGRKLTGMRAGIIGLGRIGIEIARRLEGFKTTIAYADPVVREVPYRRYADAEALAANSDIVFLAAAGAPKGKAAPLVGSRSSMRSGRAASSSISRAAGWSTSRRWYRRWPKDGSVRPGSTSSTMSRACLKR
jgi:lactate dehydrogenase-like 2-hydroxyacid dehydrogenase